MTQKGQKVSANNDGAICGMVLCQHVAKAGTGIFSLPTSYIDRHWVSLSASKLHRQALGWFLF
jgi:hypothetical protein